MTAIIDGSILNAVFIADCYLLKIALCVDDCTYTDCSLVYTISNDCYPLIDGTILNAMLILDCCLLKIELICIWLLTFHWCGSSNSELLFPRFCSHFVYGTPCIEGSFTQ